jgi:hypothetical protein
MGKSSKIRAFAQAVMGVKRFRPARYGAKNPRGSHYDPPASVLPSTGVAGPPHAVKY